MDLQSRVTFYGHPLHAMLVVFPLGLLFTSFLFDLLYLWRKDHFWARAAFWLMSVGTAGALASVATGLFDYSSIPMPSQARQTATLHLYLGLTVVALYSLQLWLRRSHSVPVREYRRHSWGLLVLSFVSVQAIGLQGWLGGEVSHVHGVGVVSESKRPDVLREEPLRGGQSASPVAGAAVFRRVCAGCHGMTGGGGVGPRLRRTQHPHEIAQIIRIVRQGKPPLMPAFKNQLSDGEMDSVAGYVRALMTGRSSEEASSDPDKSIPAHGGEHPR